MKQDLKDTVEDPEEKSKTLFLSTVDLADTEKNAPYLKTILPTIAAKVTHFRIKQPEGNDGEGSDCSNTSSPHHQDLCPG